MVFNGGMSDAELIADLGGPARVAELMGYPKAEGGVQRVHNWIKRGIPPKVKLQRPELFLARAHLPPELIGADGAPGLPAPPGGAGPIGGQAVEVAHAG